MSKELIEGFGLNLEDFTGDVELLVRRLEDTVSRLKKTYSTLTFIRSGDTLQMYGERIKS